MIKTIMITAMAILIILMIITIKHLIISGSDVRCRNCGTRLTKEQIKEGAFFCSKPCSKES